MRWARSRGLLALPGGQQRVAPPQVVADQAQLLTLGDELEHVGADVVDERDPRLGDQQRADVGVAARERRRRVHHGGRGGPDEVLGRHPVDVGVVDDGDVPRAEPLDQVFRPAIGAGGAHDDAAPDRSRTLVRYCSMAIGTRAPTGPPGRTSP